MEGEGGKEKEEEERERGRRIKRRYKHRPNMIKEKRKIEQEIRRERKDRIDRFKFINCCKYCNN